MAIKFFGGHECQACPLPITGFGGPGPNSRCQPQWGGMASLNSYLNNKGEIMVDNDRFKPPNSFQMLMKQIGRRPLLTIRQVQELVRAMQAGDIKAFHELVEANIGLAISIAKHYRWLGLAYEDLIQEAICGLMIGIRKFDPGRGTRLSTYVTYWIRRAILQALKHNSLIDIPDHFQEDVKQFADKLRDLRAQLGKMLTLSEIVYHLNIDEKTVQDIFMVSRSTRSGDAVLLYDETEEGLGSLVEIIPDDAFTFDQAIDRLAIADEVRQALSCLSGRDQEIVRLRYGIGDDYPHTLDEVA